MPSSTKSTSLTVAQIKEELRNGNMYPTVPAELKALKQWVLLKEELRNGKPTKIPYQVDDNRANANDPNTWTDFQTACNHRDHFSDIGFVFSKDDPYCGIYIHNCMAPGQYADLSKWARPLILEGLGPVAYGEASISNYGVKFWTRAKLPDWMNKGKRKSILPAPSEIEVYHYGRYFTVTGKGMGKIKDGQDVVDAIMYLIQLLDDREIRETDLFNYYRKWHRIRQAAKEGNEGAQYIFNEAKPKRWLKSQQHLPPKPYKPPLARAKPKIEV